MIEFKQKKAGRYQFCVDDAIYFSLDQGDILFLAELLCSDIDYHPPRPNPGKFAYNKRQKGEKWTEIGEQLNYTGNDEAVAQKASNMAKYYALKHNLDWPLKR